MAASVSRLRLSACELQPLGDGAVAAVARGQVARDAADGGDADAGLPVDLAVGQAALQQFDHRPAVGHGLQFGRRAQVAEEAAAFLDAAQRQDRGAQRALVLLFLALTVTGRLVFMGGRGFESNVLTH